MDIDGLSANLCNNGYSQTGKKTALSWVSWLKGPHVTEGLIGPSGIYLILGIGYFKKENAKLIIQHCVPPPIVLVDSIFIREVVYSVVKKCRGGHSLNWISFTSKPRPNQLQYNDLIWFGFDKSHEENQTKPI